MVRVISAILGIGLVLLWLVGISTPGAPGWLSWLDGVAAIWAFVIAGSASVEMDPAQQSRSPIALSIGLFALWIVGLAAGSVPWLCWWTFAFAVAFLILGISAGRVRPVSARSESVEEKIRRVG